MRHDLDAIQRQHLGQVAGAAGAHADDRRADCLERFQARGPQPRQPARPPGSPVPAGLSARPAPVDAKTFEKLRRDWSSGLMGTPSKKLVLAMAAAWTPLDAL